MIEAMDVQIGRVLQALDAHGLADDTIVIFTSDNGGERFSDTWPFTGIKTELLEGGLRVPTLICWPARIPAGQVSDQVAITMDWFPTLLDAAGVAPAPRTTRPTASAFSRADRPHARRSSASCSGATRPTHSERMRDGDLQVPEDPRQQLPVQRRG